MKVLTETHFCALASGRGEKRKVSHAVCNSEGVDLCAFRFKVSNVVALNFTGNVSGFFCNKIRKIPFVTQASYLLPSAPARKIVKTTSSERDDSNTTTVLLSINKDRDGALLFQTVSQTSSGCKAWLIPEQRFQ